MKKAQLICAVLLAGILAVAQNTAANKKAATTANTAAKPASASAPTTDEVNSFMRHMFGYDPKLQWQVVRIAPSEASGMSEVLVSVKTDQGQQPLQLFITPDGKHAINGEMVPFAADPFAAARQVLAHANGPSKGPADASLTIVEFSDLQCPHCKAAQPVVDRLLADNPNARFVFQNFPLSIHNWAMKAAEWADCIGRENNDAFWKFVSGVYQAQDRITAENADTELQNLAGNSGANAQTAKTCAADPGTKTRVDQSLALGKEVGITGTPTVYLNGRRIADVVGIPYDMLNAIAKFQAESK
jgi:protein-disulfide isomerase